MTLVEVQARLNERGTPVGIGTVHRFFVRHAITRNKDRARDRTGPSRRPEATPALVRQPDRSRTRTPRLHRRDLDHDQHDPQSRALPERRTAADGSLLDEHQCIGGRAMAVMRIGQGMISLAAENHHHARSCIEAAEHAGKRRQRRRKVQPGSQTNRPVSSG